MKTIKFLIMSLVLILFVSCAESKTFEVKTTNGELKTIKVEPYGLANKETKIDGVKYQICTGNIILDIIFSESLIVPVYLIGWELYEPVSLESYKIENGVLIIK